MKIKGYSEKVDKAIEFATKAHEGQFRFNSTTPYVVHPIEVAEIVFTAGGDESQICAGLLHDVVEDCEVELSTIEKEFGKDVAQLVDELTNKATLDMGNRATRKQFENARIVKTSARAKMVKLADIMSNTRTINEAKPKFARLYLTECLDRLEILQEGGPLCEKAAAMVKKALSESKG